MGRSSNNFLCIFYERFEDSLISIRMSLPIFQFASFSVIHSFRFARHRIFGPVYSLLLCFNRTTCHIESISIRIKSANTMHKNTKAKENFVPHNARQVCLRSAYTLLQVTMRAKGFSSIFRFLCFSCTQTLSDLFVCEFAKTYYSVVVSNIEYEIEVLYSFLRTMASC